MTLREAYALAAKLWRSDTTIELLHRGRKSPRFKVGYADLGTGRTVTMGTSDVDWESAFMNAAAKERP